MYQASPAHGFSRRDFLRMTGSAAGVALLAACTPAGAPTGGGGASQEPVTIRYAGLESMGARVEEFLGPWIEEQGYTWERGSFGQQELTDKIMQSVATNTYLADVFQFPSNARADVIAAKALMPVPEEVQDEIDWDDILPSIIRTLSWEGTPYALPYDGDVHYYAFRKDLLADAEISGRFKETYGYDLGARLARLGIGPVPGGSLYPALVRLENQGWLVSEWRAAEGGRGRKYYAITDAGREHLDHRRRRWEQFASAVGDVFAQADHR